MLARMGRDKMRIQNMDSNTLRQTRAEIRDYYENVLELPTLSRVAKAKLVNEVLKTSDFDSELFREI